MHGAQLATRLAEFVRLAGYLFVRHKRACDRHIDLSHDVTRAGMMIQTAGECGHECADVDDNSLLRCVWCSTILGVSLLGAPM